MKCINHPGTETVLRCNKCERPICAKCVIQTPVGGRCRECARLRRLPQYDVPPVYLLRAVATALVVGGGIGLFVSFASQAVLVPLALQWLLYPLTLVGAGYLVGEAVSRATNRKQGRTLQVVAAGGMLTCLVALILLTPVFLFGLYTILGLIVGLALAVNPFR